MRQRGGAEDARFGDGLYNLRRWGEATPSVLWTKAELKGLDATMYDTYNPSRSSQPVRLGPPVLLHADALALLAAQLAQGRGGGSGAPPIKAPGAGGAAPAATAAAEEEQQQEGARRKGQLEAMLPMLCRLAEALEAEADVKDSESR